MRPWAPWRTIETRHFRFHFPAEFEPWTVDAARRVESVDSAITSLVGWSPPRPVDVVVHDPFTSPNGYVLPTIDRPTTVWWATPPTPRGGVDGFRSWSEMLAVHELAHLAHLTRPTRNPIQRLLWSTLPAQFGPVARKSPRWVVEGYATMIEGRITGSGRPNGVWRPALLRQWAIEGRLPTYDELSRSRAFSGGSFAYLNGSAFFEWLADREGDSSLVHVWRRMSARTPRTFDQSFAGVFGEPPRILYGRHAAELTADAMRARDAIYAAGLREGDLIQRLSWATGDPAVSPDGRRVALTLAAREGPPRLVVWATTLDSGSTADRRRRAAAAERAARRDSLDVPDRQFVPPPKRAVESLLAINGLPYQSPRWYADNRRIMVARWTPRDDGTLGPDLYTWDLQNHVVKRLTHNQGLVEGDPSPDSREAVATRCHRGHCDVVRLYLPLNTVSPLLEGDHNRSYYRPRFSPDGSQFAASVSDSGRWRVVVADRNGRNARVIDPGDGANRYDAEWVSSDTLLVVSERGGVPNLEYLSLGSATVRSLSRVTGAAVAPSINRTDQSTWFLSLHSRGLDVRRLPPDVSPADSVVPIDGAGFGYAGPRHQDGTELRPRPAPPSEPYRLGPAHARWLPGAYGSVDGVGGQLALFRGDIIGRVNTTAVFAWGEPGAWQGGALRTAVRVKRPSLEFGAHWFRHEPSLGRQSAGDDRVDAAGYQFVVAAARDYGADWKRLSLRTGVAGGRVEPTLGPSHARTVGFVDADVRFRYIVGTRGSAQRVRFHYSEGQLRSRFQRWVLATTLGTAGPDVFPLQVSGTMGRVHGSRHPFEEFSLGGIPSPTLDSSLFSQRFAMPGVPSVSKTGRVLFAWRIAVPMRYTLYVEGASLGANTDRPKDWRRVVGVESRWGLPPIPVAFTPALQAVAGAAFSIDKPYNDGVSAYLSMRFTP